jgi:hypothetical protein
MRLEAAKRSLKDEQVKLAGFTDDWDYFNEVAPADEKGNRPNPIILNDIEEVLTPKEAGNRLHKIEKDMDTIGYLLKIGSLYRFTLSVRTFRDRNDKKYNLFYVIGNNEHRYMHNHGHIAKTPEIAARYFISALGHLPRKIEEVQKNIETMENDIPVLEKILENQWNNAPKLQKLKSELSALDRKIMTTLSSIEN